MRTSDSLLPDTQMISYGRNADISVTVPRTTTLEDGAPCSGRTDGEGTYRRADGKETYRRADDEKSYRRAAVLKHICKSVQA